jgi:hypothetical protein
MGELYRQWRTPPGKSPAQALHAAQAWLRTVTADELYDLLDPLTSAANPLGLLAANLRTSLFAQDPEQNHSIILTTGRLSPYPEFKSHDAAPANPNAEILSVNWDQIRLLIGDMSPALAAGISAIAAKLQNPISLEELPKIIDDLLRLIRNTPAGSYARQFIARANMGVPATTRSANPDVLAPAGIDPRPLVESTGTARNLGSVLTASEDSLGITRFPILYATNCEWNGTVYTGEPGALSYFLARK